MKKYIKIVLYTVIFFWVSFIVCGEIDRRTYRKKIPSPYAFRHKYPLSPVNLFVKYNSFEDRVPFLDLERNFPSHVKLQSAWKAIRNEALNLIQANKTSKIEGDLFFDKKITSDGKWKKYYIKWYSPISKDIQNECPVTTSLVKSLPEVQLAMFSILEPGAKIKVHTGPFKGCLRYHLGLKTPNNDKCRILVDGEEYSWRDGEDVLFDDTYEHEVENKTDQVRIILFCDVKRKLKSEWANKINSFICDKIAPITTRSNNKNETVEKIENKDVEEEREEEEETETEYEP